MFWKKDEMDFILPFQKIIDGDIMTFRFFNKLNYFIPFYALLYDKMTEEKDYE